METNELRIGNYILDKKDENIEYVYHIHDLGDIVLINDLRPDACIPIPLTEKWLLKFGFESSMGFEGQKYDPNDEFASQFVYTLDSGISHLDFTCRPSKGWIIKLGDSDNELEIEFVHQFQNAFFALKGKELTFKK
ncbi:hypothetical protein [Chryseobacterium viscerum]|uniref:Uncharacterized protein n=1 Tax=Chryseobacterium viscerum TaxID=1037377 RepID=A0A316WHC0_9FLAO|nr:hypothetical protein [Chryseobacterium viscerum]PWN60875.1 hypothetical protein C1634_012450 [Chryseobacterium viscerum]